MHRNIFYTVNSWVGDTIVACPNFNLSSSDGGIADISPWT